MVYSCLSVYEDLNGASWFGFFLCRSVSPPVDREISEDRRLSNTASGDIDSNIGRTHQPEKAHECKHDGQGWGVFEIETATRYWKYECDIDNWIPEHLQCQALELGMGIWDCRLSAKRPNAGNGTPTVVTDGDLEALRYRLGDSGEIALSGAVPLGHLTHPPIYLLRSVCLGGQRTLSVTR